MIQHLKIVIVMALSFQLSGLLTPALADTATFLQPANLTVEELTALSTSGDSAGLTIDQSESLQLLFDQPFSVDTLDRVSIFTLPTGNRNARGTIRIGTFVDGSAQIVRSRNFRSGRTVNFNNFVARQCQDLGGCNFIEIITRRPNRKDEGVQVDYIQINGEVVSVAAPTPEPHVWAFMIMGFIFIAWRIKSIRKKEQNAPFQQAIPPPFYPSDHHKPLAMMS